MTSIPEKKSIKFNGRCTEAQDKLMTEMMADLGIGRSEVLLHCLEQVAAKNEDVTSDLQRVAALAEPLEDLAMNGKALIALVGDMQKIAKMGEKLDALVGKLEGFEAAASGQKEDLEKLLKTMPAELERIGKAISSVADSADKDRAGYAKQATERLDEISRSLNLLSKAVFGDPKHNYSGMVAMIREIRDHARLAGAHAEHWYEHTGKIDRYEAVKEEIAAAREKTKPPLRVV